MNDKSQPLSRRYSTVACSRRRFLQSALLGMIAGSTSACHPLLPVDGRAQTADTAWLPLVITDPEAAARLGRRYLMAYPEQNDANRLLEHIEKTVAKQQKLPSRLTDGQQFTDALRRQVRSEYAHDEVVSVAGWVLSTTEAQLYALVSLIADTDPAINQL